MRIVIRCSDAQREELESGGVQEGAELVWVFEKDALRQHKTADAIIDLLFENETANIALLQEAQGVKIINSVIDTLPETDPQFIRINGWPTFLKGAVVEGSGGHEDLKKLAATVFSQFGKSMEWLPDEVGFVVPRVVCMIINEAYFALEQGVSTQAEIDTAMKLGTAYPYGPFEWGEKLGLRTVAALLTKLSLHQKRYAPAPLLVQGVTGPQQLL